MAYPPTRLPAKITGMRVLVVGGAGYVASLVMPALRHRHEIRVLDTRSPSADVEHISGSATDYAELTRAVDGMDAVIHCAMGSLDWSTPQGAADAFDINVKSVHLTLMAARDAGVQHAVYISSLSVFGHITARRVDETTPADATDLYGLTKRLGEQVCLAAAAEWGLSVNVLRLVWPTPDEVWPAWGPWQTPELLYTDDGTLIQPTRASDLGAAILAALDHRDGCQIFTISGDESARLWSTAKARRLLGWAPTAKGD
jgi:nucleoside-diphosphate-sugar epimerase